MVIMAGFGGMQGVQISLQIKWDSLLQQRELDVSQFFFKF